MARLRQHAAHTESEVARQPCSFLQDNRRSIYSVRPAACRKAHSLSAQHCASLSAQIPQNLRLLLDAEALMAGTAQAYRNVQLPASAHELNVAVLAALTDSTAQHRCAGITATAPRWTRTAQRLDARMDRQIVRQLACNGPIN